MNDSLELDAPLKTRPPARRSASGPELAERATRVRVPPPCDAASVEGRLRAVLPWLFERSRASDISLLVELASKRLGGLLDEALATARSRLGAFACTLAPQSRLSLQDALLTTRVRLDELLPDAIDHLSPGELVAMLADGCATHPHARMHAFRLRRAIEDRRDLSAREAMLDRATNGTGDVLREALASMVERRLVELLATHPLLPRSVLARVADREHAHDRQAAAQRRVTPTAMETFAQALGRGDRDAAIDLLAGQAGVRRSAVETALFLRTPRGLLSLAWRAGLDADLSAALQSRLGRIAPSDVLHTDEAGEWPMSETEMEWQCRFLSEFHLDSPLTGRAPHRS